ncbi:M1 family aminopeptidase [Flavobacterium sp.]|uniref:M1 family aminopeptidase n=1 Tax=Flavobacterium sp. TaxID=239 RepID=UPI0028BD742A|nr:M1 family aminopeptidase [Flavobacterium sp.]
MKKFALFFTLFLGFLGFSQSHDEDFHKIVEAEMKSAASAMAFQANPNTQNYDVRHHRIELTTNIDNFVNVSGQYRLNITGKVTTSFIPNTATNSIVFDLTYSSNPTYKLTIGSVIFQGSPITFSHNATDELVLIFPSNLTSGNTYSVEINYSGYPSTNEQAFTCSYHDSTPILWTLSEPFGARDWWPCKQDLNDKIDNGVDVYITAPIAYSAVSNGLQQSAIPNGANKTTHFHHGYPIPAYLVAIAVTNYQTYNQQAGLGTPESPFFPIINYLYPESNNASTQNALAVTPPIMNLFESLFGAYPFRTEKYGHAQFGWGGGMEHTTVSFMGGWSRGLIAHELGHHWFGDKVTCGTWKDIWLNEGLTEYMAGLVVEAFDGAASFVNWKANKITSITSQPGGNLYLTDAQATNVNTIFSSRISYNKGSMVTHMLRYKLGDTNFYQGMNNYLNDPLLAYGYAVTPQLQQHLETASGMDLDEFFNDWVYMQGYPIYDITAYNFGPGQAKITVNQTTSHTSVPFFEMPVPVRLLGAGGLTHDVIVDNTSNGQEFIVSVPFPITDLEFDPNRHIISNGSTASLSSESFELNQMAALYPNPANDKITIQLPNTMQLENVSIYNTLGQLVATNTNTTLDVSSLSSGVHLVKIATSEGTIHKNFIKK